MPTADPDELTGTDPAPAPWARRPGVTAAPPPRHRPRRRPRARTSRFRVAARVALLTVALLLVPVAWSYGHALTRPSSETLGIRTTEWVRDHGGRAIVAWAETTWYNHHQPKKGGLPAASALPRVTAAPATTPPTTLAPVDAPSPVSLLARPALTGEGQWQPTGRTGADGLPLLYTTFMRPDPVHTSLVTGLAWMDPKRVTVDLYSGYDEPGGKGWALTAPLPYELRPGLVAAFNSGFKLADSQGGYMAEGRVAAGHPLVNGKASLVIRSDGTATVGMWGRDAVAGPDITRRAPEPQSC